MQQILKHKWIVGAGLLLVSSFAVLSFTTKTAYADYANDSQACSYTFTDSDKKIVQSGCDDSNTFTQSNSNTYTYTSPTKKCKLTIKVAGSHKTGTLSGKYENVEVISHGTTNSCEDAGSASIGLAQYGAKPTEAGSANTVVADKLKSIINKQCGPDKNFHCTDAWKNYISSCNTSAMNTIKSNYSPAAEDEFNGEYNRLLSDCISKKSGLPKARLSAAIGNTIYDDIQKGYASDSSDWEAAGDVGDKPDEDDTADCEGTNAVLGWILCPVIETIANAADGIYENLIQPLLTTKPITLDASNPMFKAWSQFRILGDAFLIIALLIIVFGQSIGGGLVDAYTAKKVLPRLLIAAIGINLSIYFVAALVDLTNIIGNGIISLMETPFKQADAFKLTLNGGAGGLGIGALITGGGIVWATGSAFFAWFFVFLLVPLLLTLLAIFGVVLIRRGLILFLVLVAPVAFALYCLPNTEQYFRKWWDLLFKTLLVYPIIAAVFGIANVMSVTITAASDGFSKSLAGLISVVVLVLPLFLIPFSFRLAGGLLGRLHDVLTDGRNRAHEAIKGNANDPGSLQNRTRRNFATRRAESNISARGIGATLNPKTAFSPQRRIANRAAVREMYGSVYGEQGMGTSMYKAFQADSHVTGDIAKYGSSAASRRAIEQQIQAYNEDTSNNVEEKDRRGFAQNSAEHQQRLYTSAAADKIGRDKSMRRKALMNPATIGYELGAGKTGWNEATKIMDELAEGNTGEYRSMINEFQYVAKSAAGRADLSGATDGNAYSGDRAYQQTSLYENANGKGTSIKGFGEHFVDKFTNGNDQDKIDAAVFYKELEATLPNAKGGTADAIRKQQEALQAVGIESYMAEATGRTITRTIEKKDADGGKETRQEAEKFGDVAQKRARIYDRPDPNRVLDPDH